MKMSELHWLARAAGLATFALLLAACGKQQPKQAFGLNLEVGRLYMLSLRTSAASTFTPAGGASVTLDNSSEFRLALRPEGTTPEGETIVLVEPQRVEFMPAYSPLNKPLEAASFRMKVTPTGRIAGFVDSDAMRESVKAALAAAAPTAGSPLSPDMLMIAVSDETLTAMFQPILAVWPSVPVAAGDEWTRDDIYSPFGQVNDKTTFKVDSVTGKEATFSINTSLVSAGRDQSNLNGTGTGKVKVSADGTIRGYRTSMTMEGTIPDGNGSTIGFSGRSETQAELAAR